MKGGIKLGLIALLAVHSITWADTIRCGTKLVGIGATKVDVLVRCGDPMMKEHLRVKVSGGTSIVNEPAIAPSTSLSAKNTKQSTTIEKRRIHRASYEDVERWTYDFGKGKFLKMLIFTGGQLTAIEDGDRMN